MQNKSDQGQVDDSVTHHTICRVCDSREIDIALELSPTPLADMFVPQADAPKFCKEYPLSVGLCRNCGYLHLSWTLNADLLYPDFVYTTSTTVGLINHYREYADQMLRMVDLTSSDLIVDIGSNDGSFLQGFLACKSRLQGVEPGRVIAEKANELVPTKCGYFDDNLVDTILAEHGKATLITTNYTYANIDNILEFSRSVKRLLADNGLFVVQTGYHPDQMDKCMFDYIYHEHISYFSFGVVKKILAKSGLEPISVSRNSMKGGSIRIVAQHVNGDRKIDETIATMLSEEHSRGVRELATYRKFSTAIETKGLKLRKLLDDLVATGERIIGYGASHSTTTFLYHYKLKSYLDYIVDDNLVKQGTVSPGYLIPVYSPTRLNGEQEIFVLILAWQHAENIISRNSALVDRGVRFILPFPEPHVYGYDSVTAVS